MLAIDWAYTKNFAIHDGKKTDLVPWEDVIKEAKKHDKVVIEHGAPLLYLYRLVRTVPTYTILPIYVAEERKRLGLEKTDSDLYDMLDAQIIYDIASNGRGETAIEALESMTRIPLSPLHLDAERIRVAYLYHQFLYSLKAQVATNNLMKSMKRHFGDAENPTLSLLLTHTDEYEKHRASLRKEIEKLSPEPPDKIINIKGMSKWLWCGIMVFANPQLFNSKSGYRKWCGLINRKNLRNVKAFSHPASRIYYLCADSFMKQRTPYWRGVYDKAKEELSNREGYTHPHGGAMNRVMTKFANFVYDTVKEEGITKQGGLW